MRALLSVYDKSGIVPFARKLTELGYDLVSTGNTFAELKRNSIPVDSVESVTGSPEMLDGRVKTLHPRIHGGLLARHDRGDHLEQLRANGIELFHVLVSNLYPFEEAVQQPGLTDSDKMEQIDIGGPAMVRAAAKNFDSVLVVTEPDDYDEVLNRLESNTVDSAFRRACAARAFGHLSAYDSLIASFLRNDAAALPDRLTIGLRKSFSLRYGENPHQLAAAYTRLSTDQSGSIGVLDAESLAGPALSFNNYLDADAAWNAVQHFQSPAASVVKHMVPCGLAVRDTPAAAFQAAFAGDPISAFGGIVAFNCTVDAQTATALRKIRVDIIIAPSYDEAALSSLRKKKATRLLKLGNLENADISHALDVRPIRGGMLVQTPDTSTDDPLTWNVVTKRQPDPDDLANMTFAWSVARMVKSNAIVIAAGNAVLGLGAGQPNRLESVNLAVGKAGERAKGAALASDAFFPFADGLELAIAAGVTAVVQPGGSVRDHEVIDAANAADICMLFTGMRHFRH